jgi:hypothetical protein
MNFIMTDFVQQNGGGPPASFTQWQQVVPVVWWHQLSSTKGTTFFFFLHIYLSSGSIPETFLVVHKKRGIYFSFTITWTKGCSKGVGLRQSRFLDC